MNIPPAVEAATSTATAAPVHLTRTGRALPASPGEETGLLVSAACAVGSSVPPGSGSCADAGPPARSAPAARAGSRGETGCSPSSASAVRTSGATVSDGGAFAKRPSVRPAWGPLGTTAAGSWPVPAPREPGVSGVASLRTTAPSAAADRPESRVPERRMLPARPSAATAASWRLRALASMTCRLRASRKRSFTTALSRPSGTMRTPERYSPTASCPHPRSGLPTPAHLNPR